MGEGSIHNLLKEIGKETLRGFGFRDTAIVEEYGVCIDGKKYVVDLAAFAPRAETPSGKVIENYRVAVECGDVDQEKLEALKKRFDNIIHLSLERVLESHHNVLKHMRASKVEKLQRELSIRGVEQEKSEVLRIRCKPETLDRFKKFAQEYKTFEAALLYLMNYREGEVSKVPVKTYVGPTSK